MERNYQISKDINFKLLLLEETIKGYKLYLTNEQLQEVVDAFTRIYYEDMDEHAIDEMIAKLGYLQNIFINARFHNDDSVYNIDALSFIIEYQKKSYMIGCNSKGIIDMRFIENMYADMPFLRNYVEATGCDLSLEHLSHQLYGTGAKYSGITTAINNHRADLALRNCIVLSIINKLLASDEDIDMVEKYVNMLNRKFNMCLLNPKYDARHTTYTGKHRK